MQIRTLDIMMPYYGDVALMQQAVNSVIAQGDPRWRLTVLDDGQAPGVPEWFAHLGHPQVRYHRNPHNLGVTTNFQQCVERAEHDFMVIMGCDDVMLPNYVAVVHRLLDQYPQADIIQPGVQVIDTHDRPARSLVDQAKRHLYKPRVRGALTLSGQALAVSLLRGDWLYFPSLCWRTQALAAVGFNARFSVIQDLDVLLRMVRRGATLVACDEVCFCYRRHPRSKSSADAATGSRFTEARRFFLQTAAEMQAHGWPRAASVARRHLSSRLFALTLLPGAVARGNSAGARALAAHTLGPSRARDQV